MEGGKPEAVGIRLYGSGDHDDDPVCLCSMQGLCIT